MALIAATAACSTTGDLGRSRKDYVATNIAGPIDRKALVGGGANLSTLPVADDEQLMYDLVWRFFIAPQSKQQSLFGRSKILPTELHSGKSADHVPDYYTALKRADFQSSQTRYSAVADTIRADLETVGPAFAAVCAVERLDSRRRTAAGAFPELEDTETAALDLRLNENANAIANFALVLDFRYQAYSYALKRLLVETPDEAARAVDANLSALGIRVDAARNGAFCAG